MKLVKFLPVLAIASLLGAPAMAQTSATQTLTLNINGGALSISGGGGTSAFTAVASSSLTSGPNQLTLAAPPTFAINDARGATDGWSVALSTSTTTSPTSTTAANQHLFYNVGTGAPTLNNLSNFTGSYEGFLGNLGLGNAAVISTTPQDTNLAPVKTVSAASGAACTGNQGIRNYRVGNSWALQDTTGGGSVPSAGAYSWTLTATITAAP